MASLRDHRHLGVHTELVSDGIMDLVEAGAVTGTRKQERPNKVVATFALGTQQLYDWLHDNGAVEMTEGSAVTTLKNTVDHVVTEHGIAHLRGRSIADRARALIAIAHPDHRDDLEREARECGLLPARARVGIA